MSHPAPSDNSATNATLPAWPDYWTAWKRQWPTGLELPRWVMDFALICHRSGWTVSQAIPAAIATVCERG